MTPDNPPIAACHDPGTRVYFDISMERHDFRAEARAKEACNSCPLLDTCRDVYTREEFKDVVGVVGGMTHAERFPDRPTVTRLICGTPNGSRTHYRRG